VFSHILLNAYFTFKTEQKGSKQFVYGPEQQWEVSPTWQFIDFMGAQSHVTLGSLEALMKKIVKKKVLPKKRALK
jgi:hypothetical protein